MNTPCFRKILFYADPISDIRPALRYALRMAKADNAEVTVVDSLDHSSSSLVQRWLPASLGGEESAPVDEHVARLEGVAGEFRAQGTVVATKLLQGPPADAITREVLREGHDLVIKTAQGDPGEKERGLFGGVAIRLMRDCPCAVCVVDPREDERFDRILAAVDPETHDPQHVELNERILDLSATLAEREGGDLYVVHAWTAFAESVLHLKMADEEVAAYAEKSRAQVERDLAQLTAPLRTRAPHAQIHVDIGHSDPDEVLAVFTREHKIDLVVMGTVGRRGLQGAIMGNTAEKILRRVPCSVMALKPSTFVCPIHLDQNEAPQEPTPVGSGSEQRE